MNKISVNFLPMLYVVSFALGGRADVAAQSTDLTDPQIIKIVETANTAEIAAGRYAEKSAKQNDVKEFAKDMVGAHSKSNSEVEKLSKTLDLQPADSMAADDLKKDTTDDLSNLKKLKGAKLDKAYVDGQVKAHRMVLATFDDKLIPNAKDPQLKSLLIKTRTVVEAHLEHATKVQQSMK